ncbi:MAG TPA: nuclear transport factor 2 family protein [Pyrinomonadaceae bacterium]
MKRNFSLLLISLAFTASALAQESKMPPEVRSLVEAERAFAAKSVEKGIRESFLANLADDSILFRPLPVNGKKWMEEHTNQSGVLTWRPVFADVSSAGDIGYTTGPWEYREKSLEDKPVAYGYFVTIWKKQPGGIWKALVDLGTRNPEPQSTAMEVTFPAGKRKAVSKADVAAARTGLLQAENDFSKLVTAEKSSDSYLKYLADDVRFYRMNAFPLLGKKATRDALAAKPQTITWQTTKGDVSQSGDLGYTYGLYEFKAGEGERAESGNYLRIWKKQADGKWRVVLDLLNPVPPPKP